MHKKEFDFLPKNEAKLIVTYSSYIITCLPIYNGEVKSSVCLPLNINHKYNNCCCCKFVMQKLTKGCNCVSVNKMESDVFM